MNINHEADGWVWITENPGEQGSSDDLTRVTSKQSTSLEKAKKGQLRAGETPASWGPWMGMETKDKSFGYDYSSDTAYSHRKHSRHLGRSSVPGGVVGIGNQCSKSVPPNYHLPDLPPPPWLSSCYSDVVDRTPSTHQRSPRHERGGQRECAWGKIEGEHMITNAVGVGINGSQNKQVKRRDGLRLTIGVSKRNCMVDMEEGVMPFDQVVKQGQGEEKGKEKMYGEGKVVPQESVRLAFDDSLVASSETNFVVSPGSDKPKKTASPIHHPSHYTRNRHRPSVLQQKLPKKSGSGPKRTTRVAPGLLFIEKRKLPMRGRTSSMLNILHSVWEYQIDRVQKEIQHHRQLPHTLTSSIPSGSCSKFGSDLRQINSVSEPPSVPTSRSRSRMDLGELLNPISI